MKSPLPKIKESRVLTDWVIDSLREAILNDSFDPGEKINQNLICEELGVSRTPVREALKALEAEGFVEIRSHYGAFIAQVSDEDVQNIYEVRKLLESEVARQVATQIPDTVLDQLKEALQENIQAIESGDSKYTVIIPLSMLV